MKTMISPRFCPKPSLILFVLGLLSSSPISGFAYTPKNTVVATITVGTLPFSLAVGPDSSTVYVGNEVSNSISGIDTATNEVGFTISVSGQPFYLALTPDGKGIYCTLLSSNADLEFSTVTHHLVQSYATGSSPGPQAISPGGSLVYISNYNDGTLTVISNGTLLSPISVGGNPTAVIFSPDGSRGMLRIKPSHLTTLVSSIPRLTRCPELLTRMCRIHLAVWRFRRMARSFILPELVRPDNR